MTCTQTQPLLDAYADHALNPWQASRVRRHLDGCAACAAQLDSVQRVSASVHAWRNVVAPAALQGRIADALPLAPAVPVPPRNRRVARRAAFTLAGVAAAIGAGFWLLPGKPSQPTIAFADVQKAMEQVQNGLLGDRPSTTRFVTDANWQAISLRNQAPGLSVVTWLRRRPAGDCQHFQQPNGYAGGRLDFGRHAEDR